ncbi:MAG TPA: hypothetical protein VMM18_06665 [Gemmatimonadaceae bacterium]|nr:hypothetical protein [Gemmatimonadaceae bacterium]
MATSRRRQLDTVRHALDEARFGAARTLNLRAMLPTVREAVGRAESWLRQRQVEGAGEVLVVTGRGHGSPDGVSPVREAVRKLLVSLRRRGVVAEHAEHTAGSFVVRLAPTSALWNAPRRRREPPAPPAADPPALRALEPQTADLLRRLAVRSLESLGVREPGPLVESEMIRQFAVLAQAIPDGPERETRFRAALSRALEEYETED